MPICKIALKIVRPLPEAYPQQLVTWGDHLRKKRLDRGLLQKDVAKILHVNPDTICNWENNNTEPELVHLPRIINFLSYAPYFGSCRSLGEKIVRYREFLGLSQEALSRHLGIDSGTLRRWENNESEPIGRRFESLSRFFHFCAKGSFS